VRGRFWFILLILVWLVLPAVSARALIQAEQAACIHGTLDSDVTLGADTVSNTGVLSIGRDVASGCASGDFLIDDLRIYAGAIAQQGEALSGLSCRYTYGLDLISQTRLEGGTPETWYYGYDGHGSVRTLVDASSGTITDSYDYDAYGMLLSSSSGSTPNNYRYSGEQWDQDLGAYYLRARYYKHETGRFWTMDTFEGNQQDPLSLHKYLYCAGNPVNMTDPSGNEVEPDQERGNQVHELFYVHCIVWHGIPKYFDAEIGQVFPNITSQLRPDVLDVNKGRRRFFELKPISYRDWPVAAVSAAEQVGSYVEAMKAIPVLPGDAKAEFPGRTPIGVIFDPVEQKLKEVVIEASETTPGLIYYWLRNPQGDLDLELLYIPISVPAAQRAVWSYGGNAAASAVRAVAGRTAIQSRTVMAAMRAIGPSISARISLLRF